MKRAQRSDRWYKKNSKLDTSTTQQRLTNNIHLPAKSSGCVLQTRRDMKRREMREGEQVHLLGSGVKRVILHAGGTRGAVFL